ncbi:hypothetical protein Pcinc_043465 [Petrolisthes cinctipes]|uniref:Uncharacterized protein n=1 Tax=Petrolisthes cinctipes TaxID=88211 RepID=A0AAE1EG85_PETCI|nr:hypothetical protein Pcinc_043465 [Petrolisthes cinctipes]
MHNIEQKEDMGQMTRHGSLNIDVTHMSGHRHDTDVGTRVALCVFGETVNDSIYRFLQDGFGSLVVDSGGGRGRPRTAAAARSPALAFAAAAAAVHEGGRRTGGLHAAAHVVWRGGWRVAVGGGGDCVCLGPRHGRCGQLSCGHGGAGEERLRLRHPDASSRRGGRDGRHQTVPQLAPPPRRAVLPPR